MHPRIQEALDYLDAHHQVLLAAIARVPEAGKAHRPVPGRWSAVEVLEHLILVENRLARAIAIRTTEARNQGVGADPSTDPIFPTFDLAGFLDRDRKITAPPAVTPQAVTDAPTVLHRFLAAHAAFIAAVAAGDGVDFSALTMPHALFGEMDFYRLIAFAGAHETRHAVQLDEIGAALAGA